MTFLPIVERELRVASRRRGTYLGRMTGALVAMAIGGWIMLGMHENAPGEMGMVLFVALSAMLCLYSLGAGARITSDCLSEEKREGTLGLLFLTDLKGYDIVSGKLVANSLNIFYGLLSAFPVLGISLLMGGVTPGEFWRMSLTATNLLFLSLAVGMFASAICRDERKATSLAFAVLLLVLAAAPLIELSLNLAHRNRTATTQWLVFSPAFAAFAAFTPRIGFKPHDYWTATLLTQAYVWIFFLLASAIVPRSWQDKAARPPFALRTLWRRIFHTDPVLETARRARLLEVNPFLWLAARDPLKITVVWIVMAALTGLWIWGYLTWTSDWTNIPNYIMSAVLLHTLLKFWLATEACQRFVQDRKSGALELLLSTPLSVGEILRGQRLGLFRQFAGPALYVLAIDLFFLSMGLKDQWIGNASGRNYWVMIWLAGMTVFVMDLFALSWVSMWMGLKNLKVNRAGGASISRILVLPWLVFTVSLTVLGAIRVLAQFGWNENIVLAYWFALCVGNNLIFTTWAKRNLLDRFREIATQRFDAKKMRFAWITPGATRSKTELPPVVNLR